MKKRLSLVAAGCVGLFAGILLMNTVPTVEGQQRTAGGFAAVDVPKGGQAVFGPYDPVQNWPRPLAESRPELKGWTWSQATDVFPEGPDRVIVAQKGLLPELPSGRGRGTTWLPQIGPSLKFPV